MARKVSGPFEQPRLFSGSLSFSTDRSGRKMVIISLNNYDQPFYAFETKEKILPSGKKSFRTTSFHILEFPDSEPGEAQAEKEAITRGAIWARDSAQRAKERLENPEVSADKYRIRIDGDLQNYMAYESPSYLLMLEDKMIHYRVWESISKNGTAMLKFRPMNDKRETLIAYLKAGSTESAILRYAEDGTTTKVGSVDLSEYGTPALVHFGTETFRPIRPSGMMILPTHQRKAKTLDQQRLQAAEDLEIKISEVPETEQLKSVISSDQKPDLPVTPLRRVPRRL
jgi:hypothetical protein